VLTKQAGNPSKVIASLCVVRLRVENGFANAHAPCQAEKPDLQVRPNLKTTSEYLVESISFAVFAATKGRTTGLASVLDEIVQSKDDTDANGALAGQSWMFSLEGGLPSEFIERMDMPRGGPRDCRVICAAVGLT
jgi:hypothetical protein